jgi:hypothetical protein
LKNIHMTFYITLQPQTHHNLNEKSAVWVILVNDSTRIVIHLNSYTSYYRETREGYFQKKLEAVCPVGSQGWQDAWDKTEKGMTMAYFSTLLQAYSAQNSPVSRPYSIKMAQMPPSSWAIG